MLLKHIYKRPVVIPGRFFYNGEMVMNWKNRTIWTGDNLDIMRGMNSGSVDLIYLDPPFNSNKNYSAPIGSEAAGVAFKDTWTFDDLDDAWHGEIAEKNPALSSVIDSAGVLHGKGMKSYLIMMAVRLLELKRLLKDTGSVYLHCDSTASHYLKLLMDAIFGNKNFRNGIVWCYSTSGRSRRFFAKKHDTILLYTASDKAFWGDYRLPVSKGYLESHYRQRDEKGRVCRIRKDFGKIRVYYPEDGVTCNDWWEIPYINSMAKERVGYPTQKPIRLLDRIIWASSREGDMVLDPFCGCATACVAAELVQVRIRKEIDLFHNFVPVHRSDIPKRTDLGVLPNYRTHKRVLYGRQGGVCVGCEVLFPFWNLTVDHKVPKSKGGTGHIENL